MGFLDGPDPKLVASQYPRASPLMDYQDELAFNAVNRHWWDTCRLIFGRPDPKVVDRFVSEGITSRQDVENVHKSYGTIRSGLGVGVVVATLFMLGLGRAGGVFRVTPGWKAKTYWALFPGTSAGLVSGYNMSQWFAGEKLYSSSSAEYGGASGALLVYQYMSLVKDPAQLPEIGSSLFTDRGRPTFPIRRPLEWQKPGSDVEADVGEGGWLQVKRMAGFGFDDEEGNKGV